MEKELQLKEEEMHEVMQEEMEAEAVDELPAGRKTTGNNRGVAVVEIILILVVLIALVIIFRDQIMALVNTIWTAINGDAKTLL